MYQCDFTAVGAAYSFSYYDLPSSDEQEIRTILKDAGYCVIEVFNITKQ